MTGDEALSDERVAAESMAVALGTEHYQMLVQPADMPRVMPSLIWHLEDLRVGSSYHNYYVARLASRFVKVVLSGAGGDELFGATPGATATPKGPGTGPTSSSATRVLVDPRPRAVPRGFFAGPSAVARDSRPGRPWRT